MKNRQGKQEHRFLHWDSNKVQKSQKAAFMKEKF